MKAVLQWQFCALDEYSFWSSWAECDEDDAIRGRHIPTMQFRQQWV